MNNPFEVTSTTEEEIDSLFGGEDIPAPPGSEKKEPAKEEKPKKSNKSETDDEDSPEKGEEASSITEEEVEDLFNEVSDDDDDVQRTSKSKVDKSQVKNQVNYKAIVDYLVESGKFNEFEGREDLEEISEEDYTTILQKQIEYQVENRYREVIDSTGDVGKYIIEYTKNGGNPQDIVSLFREQRDIQSLDISTEDGQEEAIRAYLEFQGEEDSDIEDFIETAKDKGKEYFKSVAEKRHKKLLEINKQQIDASIEEQKEYKRQQEENAKQFNSNVRSLIHKNENLSQGEKKQLEKFMLSHDVQTKDGRRYTGLYAKLIEFNNDPEKLIKLANFLNDPEKFEKKIEKKAEKSAAVKTFNFVNSSQGFKHKKDSAFPEESKSKSVNPFETLKFK